MSCIMYITKWGTAGGTNGVLMDTTTWALMPSMARGWRDKRSECKESGADLLSVVRRTDIHLDNERRHRTDDIAKDQGSENHAHRDEEALSVCSRTNAGLEWRISYGKRRTVHCAFMHIPVVGTMSP